MATDCDVCGKQHQIVDPNTEKTVGCPIEEEIRAFLEKYPYAEFGPANTFV